jgi:hypothetical protein
LHHYYPGKEREELYGTFLSSAHFPTKKQKNFTLLNINAPPPGHHRGAQKDSAITAV